MKKRIKVSPEEFTKVMLEREKNYGVWKGLVKVDEKFLDDNVYYLAEIDDKWRRRY